VKLKPEVVLKSWMGFLAESTSSIASVLVDEALTWDTGHMGSSSLLFLLGIWHCASAGMVRLLEKCSSVQWAGRTWLSSSHKRSWTPRTIYFCPCCYPLIEKRAIKTGDTRKEQLGLSPQLSLDYLGLKPLLSWLWVRVSVLAFYMSEASSARYLGGSYSIALWFFSN